MNIYEKYSKEIILVDIREHNRLCDVRILDNDLNGIPLPGLFFRNVEIENSSMDKADLNKLTGENVSFTKTRLQECNFSGSAYDSLSFNSCYLIKALFDGSRLYRLSMNGCTGHGMSFNKAHIVDSVFEDCEMFKLRMNEAVLIKNRFIPGPGPSMESMGRSSIKNSIVIDCSFRGMNMAGVQFDGSVIVGCDFSNAALTDASFDRCTVADCCFEETHPRPLSSVE